MFVTLILLFSRCHVNCGFELQLVAQSAQSESPARAMERMENTVAYLDRWSWRSWSEIQKVKAEICTVKEMVNELKEMVEAACQAQQNLVQERPAVSTKRTNQVRQKPAARQGGAFQVHQKPAARHGGLY